MDPVETERVATQISLHSVKNLLGSEQQLDLFSEEKVVAFAKAHGFNVRSDISKIGIDLTDFQVRVMEAILFGFTQTKYQGNLEPVDTSSHVKEKYPSGATPNSYNYLKQLPKLQASQSQILDWAGINKGSAGDIQEALKALKHLGIAQYCFYYTRLVFDEKGAPKRDKDGDWQKEEVFAVDSLFTIKEVQDQKDRGRRYYEVIPSPIFLDQRESYFMMIPYNWREEVRKLVGKKKASSYTFRFLLFLRYKFELMRRAGRKEKKEGYIIKIRPAAICVQLRMPESVIKKKDRTNKVLEDAYSVAKNLGYLKSFERVGLYDILELNEEKYYQPKYEEKLLPLDDKKKDSPEMKQARELFDILVQEKKKLNPRHNPVVGGPGMASALDHLLYLVKNKGFEDVQQVILWGATKSYWCTRIGTASALRKNFDEAFTEMAAQNIEKKQDKKYQEQENFNFATRLANQLNEKKHLKVKVEALSKHIEISHADGELSPTCINYLDHGFKSQVENALRKRGVSLTELI